MRAVFHNLMLECITGKSQKNTGTFGKTAGNKPLMAELEMNSKGNNEVAGSGIYFVKIDADGLQRTHKVNRE